MGSIKERLRDIIVEHLDVEPEDVVEDALFIEDLGADSLDLVELLMDVEEEFDIEIPDEDAEKMNTVKQVQDYIEKAEGD